MYTIRLISLAKYMLARHISTLAERYASVLVCAFCFFLYQSRERIFENVLQPILQIEVKISIQSMIKGTNI